MFYTSNKLAACSTRSLSETVEVVESVEIDLDDLNDFDGFDGFGDFPLDFYEPSRKT